MRGGCSLLGTWGWDVEIQVTVHPRFIQLPVIKDFLDVGEGVSWGEVGIRIIQVLRNCSVGVVGWTEECFRKQGSERFNSGLKVNRGYFFGSTLGC